MEAHTPSPEPQRYEKKGDRNNHDSVDGEKTKGKKGIALWVFCLFFLNTEAVHCSVCFVTCSIRKQNIYSYLNQAISSCQLYAYNPLSLSG